MFIISNSFLGHYEINLDVGVSNTAGTLNFINDMNKSAIIYWGSLFVWCILISLFWIKVAKDSHRVISTPVEEMYHRQLVVTLDSILDARFCTSCYEEDIDTVSANTFRTRFGGNLSPME